MGAFARQIAFRTGLLLAIAAAVLNMAPATARSAHDVAQPNIVLIVTDDQSFESIYKMPYLSARIPPRGGWYQFTAAFINNPTCCPSRATILTGQWSHHTGVEQTDTAPTFRDADTLATRLDAAGYRTGFIGKYHLGDAVDGQPQSETYVPPGWDEFVEHKINNSKPYYDYTLNDNGTLVTHGSAPEDYSTDVLRDKVLDFINSSVTRQPFFVTLAPRAPHGNWTAAPRDVGTYRNEPVEHTPSFNEADMSDKPAWWQALPLRQRRNVDGARRKEWDTVLAIDDAVEAIHKRVQKLGLMSRTVIVFMTDNGFAFGEHRWNHKRCVYEECARTPLLVKFGGHSSGWTFPELVGNEDLAATFADVARGSPPADGDGQSFAPMLRKRTVPPGWQDEVLLRSANPRRDPDKPPDAWAIRTRAYKYVETTFTGEVELYDLRADPYELESVAGQPEYAAIQLELARRLAWLRGT